MKNKIIVFIGSLGLLIPGMNTARADNLGSQSRTFKFSTVVQTAAGIATNPLFHGVRPDVGLPAAPSGIWTTPIPPAQIQTPAQPGQPTRKIGFQPPQPEELAHMERLNESFHSADPQKDPRGAYQAGKIGFDLGDARRPAAVDMRSGDLSGKQPEQGKSQGFSFARFFWPKKGAPRRVPEPRKDSEIPKPDPAFRAKHKSFEEVRSDLRELLTASLLRDIRPRMSLADLLKRIDSVEVNSVSESHPHSQILRRFMSDLRVSVHSHMPRGISAPEETRSLARKIERQIEKAHARESLEKSGLNLTLTDRLVESLRGFVEFLKGFRAPK